MCSSLERAVTLTSTALGPRLSPPRLSPRLTARAPAVDLPSRRSGFVDRFAGDSPMDHQAGGRRGREPAAAWQPSRVRSRSAGVAAEFSPTGRIPSAAWPGVAPAQDLGSRSGAVCPKSPKWIGRSGTHLRSADVARPGPAGWGNSPLFFHGPAGDSFWGHPTFLAGCGRRDRLSGDGREVGRARASEE